MAPPAKKRRHSKRLNSKSRENRVDCPFSCGADICLTSVPPTSRNTVPHLHTHFDNHLSKCLYFQQLLSRNRNDPRHESRCYEHAFNEWERVLRREQNSHSCKGTSSSPAAEAESGSQGMECSPCVDDGAPFLPSGDTSEGPPPVRSRRLVMSVLSVLSHQLPVKPITILASCERRSVFRIPPMTILSSLTSKVLPDPLTPHMAFRRAGITPLVRGKLLVYTLQILTMNLSHLFSQITRPPRL